MNTITTNAALNAIGPSCQAIAHARLVYRSVRLPSIQRLSKKTMKVLEGGIEEQTEWVIANLTATLKAAGSDVSKGFEDHCLPQQSRAFSKMTAVFFERAFGHALARSTAQVTRLPLDVMVEIECIATLA